MATTSKKAKPRTPRERMASRRERLRAQGLRPVQYWVPDLRDPKVLAEVSEDIGEPMAGIEIREIAPENRLAERGM